VDRGSKENDLASGVPAGIVSISIADAIVSLSSLFVRLYSVL
jgi:hypothetical protein